jgi:hypothetical protein
MNRLGAPIETNTTACVLYRLFVLIGAPGLLILELVEPVCFEKKETDKKTERQTDTDRDKQTETNRQTHRRHADNYNLIYFGHNFSTFFISLRTGM